MTLCYDRFSCASVLANEVSTIGPRVPPGHHQPHFIGQLGDFPASLDLHKHLLH